MQPILESIAFQLLFLIIYDLFLKKETFFQWNRIYLIGTYLLSMVLPWIKIEALKTKTPEVFTVYPTYLFETDSEEVVLSPTEEASFEMPWKLILFTSGVLISLTIFLFKLYQIYRLKKKGEVKYFEDFTRVLIKNSEVAFSFFKSIFLGDKVLQREHTSIIKHELVHIKQKHSYDLVFFEILRILNWFNPLVFVYQSRISELHEFIADAQVAKTHKKEHYQLLLSQVFDTQHISFINPFFKSSLIKKRIVMLQKSKSKKVFQLKYLVLIPLLLGMLFYTSMASESSLIYQKEFIVIEEYENSIEQDNVIREGAIITYKVEKLKSLTKEEEIIRKNLIKEVFNSDTYDTLVVTDGTLKTTIKGDLVLQEKTVNNQDSIDIPFSVVDDAPIFPGCEDSEDKRACFQEKMKEHISKNFNYPEEAQEEEIQGKVNILFVINTDGSIVNLNMRGPSPILETEAKRIIDKLPKMKPGKHKGKIVRVPFSIPIIFKLHDSDIIFKKIPEDSSNDKKTQKLIERHNDLIDKRDALLKDEKSNNKDKISAIERILIKSELGIKNILEEGINEENLKLIPFSVVDEVPVFPGCEVSTDKRACFHDKIYKHISKNFKYPELAQDLEVQGRVSAMFVIDENGEVKDIRQRGPSKILEEETIRILSLLPKMKPGKNNGKAVDVPFSIPITFKLHTDSKFNLISDNIKEEYSEFSELIEEINNLTKERNSLFESDPTNEKVSTLEEKISKLKISLGEKI